MTVGKAFYTDEFVLVLNTLVREKWVKNEDWAYKLGLQEKQMNRYLKRLAKEHLVVSWCSNCKQSDANCSCRRPETWQEKKASLAKAREAQRIADEKEAAKGAPAAIPAIGVDVTKAGASAGGSRGKGAVSAAAAAEEKKEIKSSLFWYIDYKHFVNVVKYRMHRIGEKIAQEEKRLRLANSDLYRCPRPRCGQRFNALEAQQSINYTTMKPECVHCGMELVELDHEERMRSKENASEKMRRQLFDQTQDHASIEKLLRKIDTEMVLDTNDPSDSIEFANRFGHLSHRQMKEMADGSGGAGRMGGAGNNYHDYTHRIEVELVTVEGLRASERARVSKKSLEDARARQKKLEDLEADKKSLPEFLRYSSVTGYPRR